MNSTKRIALVTGANRGLGQETARQLAQRDISVIMSARDPEKGEAAVRVLKQQGLDVLFQVLDVTNADHLARVEEFILKRFGRLDILVNNAGVFPGNSADSVFDADIDSLRAGMETNLYGPLRLCQTFIPLMQKHQYGRVVNVSSGMGQLSDMNGGSPGYRCSKTALNAITRIFADELKDSNILVNSLCPGWVRTDMGGSEADLSVEEGADTIVWLAALPDDGPRGGFFRNREPIPW
ncbi:MAG: SDR family oxidoreductase [Gammaproteobacteria bacterium]|nr:SDR family oxidoreductase [Gammaproteobacteria bacterium]